VDDFPSELADYEPHDRPLRSRRTQLVLRGAVVVAVVALVLPGVLTTYSYGESNASRACAIWAEYQVPEQHGIAVHFEFFGEGVVGWECYAVTATGTSHIASLGLIPGTPKLPSDTTGA
jgi:hypothetical protein